MIARLYRIVPLIIGLIIAFVITYIIVSIKYSKARAKSVLLNVSLRINAGLAIVFVIFTIYSLLDKNQVVTEINLSCLALVAFLWIVTYIMRYFFLKRFPEYKNPATRTYFIKNKKRR